MRGTPDALFLSFGTVGNGHPMNEWVTKKVTYETLELDEEDPVVVIGKPRNKKSPLDLILVVNNKKK